LGILLETKIESISDVQGVKNYGRKSEEVKGKSLDVPQWKRVYLHEIKSILRRKRHRIPAKYSRAIRIEWRKRHLQSVPTV